MVAHAREIDLGECAYETFRKLSGDKLLLPWAQLAKGTQERWHQAALTAMEELGI